MKLMKKAFAVLAAAAITLTSGAFSANAVGLGESQENKVSFSTNGSEDVTITVTLGVYKDYGKTTLTAFFPAGMLPEGGYSFSAKEVMDPSVDEYEPFEDSPIIPEYRSATDVLVVDIDLYDADGNAVHDVTPLLTIKTEPENGVWINCAGIIEDGKVLPLVYEDPFPEDVPEDARSFSLSFTAPHLSRFVFARVVPTPDAPPPVIDDESSEPENTGKDNTDVPSNTSNVTPAPTNTDDVKTGDNSNAMAAVLIVMGIAALVTSVIAVRSKKASK